MTEPIRKVRVLHCPPAHAFRVFTEHVDVWWPPGHRRMPGSRIVLEGVGPGAELWEIGPDQRLPIGRVFAWSPPDRLELAWFLGAPAGLHTVVDVCFVGHDRGTEVRLEHRDGPRPLPNFGRTAVRFHKGWDHLLEALQVHVLDRPHDSTQPVGVP